MAQQPQMNVNMNRLTTGGKILLGGSLLLFIDLFLSWFKVSIVGFGSGTVNGFRGIGVLVGILALLIVVMEVVNLLGAQVNVGTPALRNQIEAGLAGAVALFALLRFLLKPSAPAGVDVSWGIFAFVGVVLALVIAYGGYMKWQEAAVATPPPAAPGGGGGFAP